MEKAKLLFDLDFLFDSETPATLYFYGPSQPLMRMEVVPEGYGEDDAPLRFACVWDGKRWSLWICRAGFGPEDGPMAEDEFLPAALKRLRDEVNAGEWDDGEEEFEIVFTGRSWPEIQGNIEKYVRKKGEEQ